MAPEVMANAEMTAAHAVHRVWLEDDMGRVYHPTREDSAEIARAAVRAAFEAVAAPAVTRHDDGRLTLLWPDDEPDIALVTREALTMLVDNFNALVGDDA